jgi:2-dehydropantoate 2-reductase
MKIGIVGCGAVGSYYGARLVQAGHDVHFLLRSDYGVVRRQGLQVRSVQGDFHVQPKCARLPDEIGRCDLVVIGLKTTANSEFPNLLPPLAGPDTAILTLQNGLGNEEQLARIFSVEQILGGLCFVCLNRIEPGRIHHSAHGRIVIGEFQRPPQPRTHELAALFLQSGVSCVVTEDLSRAHWEKLIWNIPFNGLGVAASAGLEAFATGQLPPKERRMGCFATDRLLAEPPWAAVVRQLMLEVIAAARALGFDLQDSLADHQIERTAQMGAYKASTLIDFERRLPLELDSLFLEPLRQAQAAGLDMPTLSALCRVLTALEDEQFRSAKGAEPPDKQPAMGELT